MCQVDDFYVIGDVVEGEESRTLAVTEAEEHHVDLVEGHLVGECQVGVAQQSLVYVGYGVAGIALAVGKNNLCLGMVKQQTDKFTAGITCCTENTYSNHKVFFWGASSHNRI